MSAAPVVRRREVAVAGVRFSLYRAEPPDDGSDFGDAPPALLLHGVPQTADMWHRLLPALARDRIVLAPDLKGLGRSEIRAPYDVPTLVTELAALVLHEVDRPVDLVGHDWGGSLALAFAAARPELVRRLVVCNAPYREVDLRRAWHLLLFGLPVLPAALLRAAGRHRVDRMIAYGWRAAVPLDEAALERYRQAYEDPARRAAMLGYYRAALGHRATAAARARAGRARRLLATRPAVRPDDPTGHPADRFTRHHPAGRGGSPHRPGDGPAPARPHPECALVLWGAADPILPVSVAAAVVRDIAGPVELLEVPGAGHFVLDEAPQFADAAIIRFLRADTGSRG